MQTTDASNFFRAEADLAKDDSRREKAERTKELGKPLDLPGKILNFKVRGDDVWTAESGNIVRRVSLETGKTLQVYKGHAGPVTCLEFHEPDLLITGSWDKTIKTWRISDQTLLSSTFAHNDFVKSLLVIPSLGLLVSGSSDKTVRFWDLASDASQTLVQLGSLSAHSRPIMALAFEPGNDVSVTLYTADSMGSINVWKLERDYDGPPRCRGTFQTELKSHRTGVNDLWVGKGLVFTASSDDTVLIQGLPLSINSRGPKAPKTQLVSHPTSAKAVLPLPLTTLEEPYLLTAAGEVIRTYSYDISSPDEPPELLSETDAHWHDITALGLWLRVYRKDGNQRIEPWILSSSLDATLRRWHLADLINPTPQQRMEARSVPADTPKSNVTEDEERELAELMDSD